MWHAHSSGQACIPGNVDQHFGSLFPGAELQRGLPDSCLNGRKSLRTQAHNNLRRLLVTLFWEILLRTLQVCTSHIQHEMRIDTC